MEQGTQEVVLGRRMKKGRDVPGPAWMTAVRQQVQVVLWVAASKVLLPVTGGGGADLKEHKLFGRPKGCAVCMGMGQTHFL